jgi:hypothetical protein
MRGVPAKCPADCDRLSYQSGYIEGQAQRIEEQAQRAKGSRH